MTPIPTRRRAPPAAGWGARGCTLGSERPLSRPRQPAVEPDLARPSGAARLRRRPAGQLAGDAGGGLAATIAESSGSRNLGRLMSYAQLLFSGDSTDAAIGRFYQTVNERVTTISSHLLFFTLELNRLDDAALQQKLADPRYALAAMADNLRSSGRTSSPTWRSCCTRRR